MNGGRPAIVQLIGQPASGKLTTAKALVLAAADAGHTIVQVDNHRTGDLILGLLDLQGKPVPPAVWARVDRVRQVVYETIETMGEPTWSYLFTNVLLADDPGDAAVVDRLRRMAERTDRRYVPVILTCADEELLRRVPNEDRAERQKWRDAEAVAEHLRTRPLLEVPDAVRVDTTTSAPEHTAATILEALQSIGGG